MLLRRFTAPLLLAYNKASGVNADNRLCDDCVTFILTGQGGTGFSQSWNLIDPSGGLATPGDQMRVDLSFAFRSIVYV